MSLLRIVARLLIGIIFVQDVAWAAAATKNTVSAINAGTTIAKKSTQSTVPSDCQEQLFGCLDTFCLMDNANGGRCTCSDDGEKYDTQWREIDDQIQRLESRTMATINAIETTPAVEKLASQKSEPLQKKSRVSLDVFNTPTTSDDDGDDEILIGDLTGRRKLNAAYELCRDRLDAKCDANMDMLTLLYNQTIKSDCLAYQNSIKARRTELANARTAARSEIEGAALDAYRAANKYDLGQCIIAYHECFVSDGVCGADWGECMPTASETTDEIMARKSDMCASVLDSCTDVRDQVYPAFLASIKNELTVAQTHHESDFRTGCWDSVTQCIVRACRDDIAGTGTATMDSCLAYPDMARSFCKIEIERCESVVPNIWDEARRKLAGMFPDACTSEVHNCLTADNACGADFGACLGLDLDALHKMCPLEKLVVCRQGNPNFSIEDLDDITMSVYMNIDNEQRDFCLNRARDYMIEICGDTQTCAAYDTQEYVGANSLAYQKVGNQHIISGLINFDLLKISGGEEWAKCMQAGNEDCDAKYPQAGKIDIDGYIDRVRQAPNDTKYGNVSGIIDRVRDELETIQASIDAVLNIYTSDPQLQMCTRGRDLSQITGRDEQTDARYPTVMNPYRLVITQSGLLRAQRHYNGRLTELTQQADSSGDASSAATLCLQMPLVIEGVGGVENYSGGRRTSYDPYSVARVIGWSASNDELTSLMDKRTEIKKDDMLTRTVWAAWSAEDKICHVYGIDKYCGKDSEVAKRMQVDKEYDDNYRKNFATNAAVGAGIGAAVTTGAIGTAVLASTGAAWGAGYAALAAAPFLSAIPVAGWAAAGALVIGSALAAIFTKKKDPYVCREREWHTETQMGDNQG